MRKCTDIYEEPRIFEYPATGKSPPMVVRVFKPILTPEERERRMKEVYKAAAAILRSVDELERQNKSNS